MVYLLDCGARGCWASKYQPTTRIRKEDHYLFAIVRIGATQNTISVIQRKERVREERHTAIMSV
jgi:hypothetical protein